MSLYTVSQKKMCQLIFCSVLVKYEPISIKIGMHVLEETFNETMQNVFQNVPHYLGKFEVTD